MNGAELVQLTEAAEVFGVSQETLKKTLDNGAVPEAVRKDDSWSLPSDSLSRIAEREGWPLDLNGQRPSMAELPDQLDRYVSETLAAHAAVVLAKTQATAARAEAQQARHRLKQARQDLEAEQVERQRATAELAESERERSVLDTGKAVAETRAEEIRRQLDYERSQRDYLTQRIGTLEQERDELVASMGWMSRRRLRRGSDQRP